MWWIAPPQYRKKSCLFISFQFSYELFSLLLWWPVGLGLQTTLTFITCILKYYYVFISSPKSPSPIEWKKCLTFISASNAHLNFYLSPFSMASWPRPSNNFDFGNVQFIISKSRWPVVSYTFTSRLDSTFVNTTKFCF